MQRNVRTCRHRLFFPLTTPPSPSLMKQRSTTAHKMGLIRTKCICADVWWRRKERERNARGCVLAHPLNDFWGGGGLKYAKLFVCITIKAEALFTLQISNALRRSLGHTSEAAQMMLLSFILLP